MTAMVCDPHKHRWCFGRAAKARQGPPTFAAQTLTDVFNATEANSDKLKTVLVMGSADMAARIKLGRLVLTAALPTSASGDPIVSLTAEDGSVVLTANNDKVVVPPAAVDGQDVTETTRKLVEDHDINSFILTISTLQQSEKPQFGAEDLQLESVRQAMDSTMSSDDLKKHTVLAVFVATDPVNKAVSPINSDLGAAWLRMHNPRLGLGRAPELRGSPPCLTGDAMDRLKKLAGASVYPLLLFGQDPTSADITVLKG